ncbi:MAG: hypothetical protein NVSMB1_21650 [Polyangiales bacterium]
MALRGAPVMAGAFGLVPRKIWREKWFRPLGADHKLAVFYLLTGAEGGVFPAFSLPAPALADALGWSLKHAKRVLVELTEAGVIDHDPVAAVVFVYYLASEFPPNGWKQAMGARARYDSLPNSSPTRCAFVRIAELLSTAERQGRPGSDRDDFVNPAPDWFSGHTSGPPFDTPIGGGSHTKEQAKAKAREQEKASARAQARAGEQERDPPLPSAPVGAAQEAAADFEIPESETKSESERRCVPSNGEIAEAILESKASKIPLGDLFTLAKQIEGKWVNAQTPIGDALEVSLQRLDKRTARGGVKSSARGLLLAMLDDALTPEGLEAAKDEADPDRAVARRAHAEMERARAEAKAQRQEAARHEAERELERERQYLANRRPGESREHCALRLRRESFATHEAATDPNSLVHAQMLRMDAELAALEETEQQVAE